MERQGVSGRPRSWSARPLSRALLIVAILGGATVVEAADGKAAGGYTSIFRHGDILRASFEGGWYGAEVFPRCQRNVSNSAGCRKGSRKRDASRKPATKHDERTWNHPARAAYAAAAVASVCADSQDLPSRRATQHHAAATPMPTTDVPTIAKPAAPSPA